MACERCAARCFTCGADTQPGTPLRVCDACFHALEGRCIGCRARDASSTAWCCRECRAMQRNNDGCPILQ